MKSRNCLIANIAPHYRYAIYKRLSEELSFDFYYGTALYPKNVIKSMDFSEFATKHHAIKNFVFLNSFFYWQKGVIGLLRKYDTFVVSGEYLCVSTWFMCFINKLFFKKRIIFWTHGMYRKEVYIKRLLKKFFFFLPDQLLLYGDYAVSFMKQEGFDSRRMFPVHNSLYFDEQCKVIANMPKQNPFESIFHNENPTIVFSGRLNPAKRLDMLIEVLFRLKKEGCAINCLIIGDGTERSSLERDMRKYQLEDTIVFYGECYDESTIGLMYWNAALCVCPGSIGLTAIHAMTYGCPVLSHNNFSKQRPEFEVIQPDISGDFFVYNDIDSLKFYIKKWISISKQEKSICNQNCRNIIKKGWTPSYQMEMIKQALS